MYVHRTPNRSRDTERNKDMLATTKGSRLRFNVGRPGDEGQGSHQPQMLVMRTRWGGISYRLLVTSIVADFNSKRINLQVESCYRRSLSRGPPTLDLPRNSRQFLLAPRIVIVSNIPPTYFPVAVKARGSISSFRENREHGFAHYQVPLNRFT